MKFLEHLSFVKSVNVEEKEYDWLNPTRPATKEEAEQMIADAETSPSMTAEQAEEYSKRLVKEWQKKKSE